MSEDTNTGGIPTWRKVAGLLFAAAVVGPLLVGMFYSYFTRTNAQQDLGDAMAYTYPYLAYVIAFIVLLIIIDYIRRSSRDTN